jgi:Polyphosphate kinase 2 (PPK2)
MARSLRDALRLPPGEPLDLAALDPRATPRAPGGKSKTAAAMATDGAELARLQEALYASAGRRAAPEVIEKRYGEIDRFEAGLADQGYAVVKCFLNISYDEQRERLLARLADPDKHWKFNEGDLAERKLWADYQQAYRIALERCSTPEAPWYAVPADRKWYRNWAIGRLLLETLRELDPQFPRPELDVKSLTRALAPPN